MIPEIVGTLSDGAHNGGGLNGQDAYSGRIIPLIAHTLRGEGFDASEDVCGRGTPLVPVAFYPTNRQPEFGIYEDISPSVKVGSGGSCGNPPAVLAFSAGNSKDSRSIALSEDHTPPLRAGSSGTNMTPTIAYGFVPKAPPNSRSMGEAIDQSPTVTTHQLGQGVSLGMQVRRLTPTECERLQGFPDGHTLIPYRGKPAADGPRYKAIGNSMAVPVMRWIGERIAMVEQSS